MQKTSIWQLWGFAATSLCGTLLHFLYDWTGKSLLAAPFSGVNESTWEHMKLLFFPLFVFALVQSCFFKDVHAFWCIKLSGSLLGIVLIPVLFYTLNGVFGQTPDWINIASFFVAAAITYLYETCLLKQNSIQCKYPKLALLALCLLAALFVLFTFFTPQIPLFRDPLNGTYGI